MATVELSIVVDADIAKSSGLTEHPVSSACRNTLSEMLDKRHKFVCCQTLREEWKRHASIYSRRWLASMYARKLVIKIQHNNTIGKKIDSLEIDHKVKSTALKDSHLLDAAAHSGKIVASQDIKAKNAFLSINEISKLARDIYWINPGVATSEVSSILRGDKPIDDSHLLWSAQTP